MSNRTNIRKLRRRALVLALSSLLLPASGPATAQATSRGGCGFYFTNPDHDHGVSARYYHCGDSFILIRVDWSSGWHYLDCVPPWYSVAFRPNGPHRVVNAYYVPIAPALMGEGSDRMCRTAQPQG
jgi:hypothetical protein